MCMLLQNNLCKNLTQVCPDTYKKYTFFFKCSLSYDAISGAPGEGAQLRLVLYLHLDLYLSLNSHTFENRGFRTRMVCLKHVI